MQANVSPSNPERPFFAVAHGRKPGVYRTRAEVHAQTQGLGLDGTFTGRMKICNTEAEAKAYVTKFGKVMNSPRRAGAFGAAAAGGSGGQSDGPGLMGACFAAMDTSRPGIYEFQPVTESYNLSGTGEVLAVPTAEDARSLLHDETAAIYTGWELNPEALGAPCFVVEGGARPGVYATDSAAFAAQLAGGGCFEQHSLFEVAADEYRTRTAAAAAGAPRRGAPERVA